VNPAGLVELVGSNVARFDYDPSTLAAKGLLIEEQRTNLLLRSEEFNTTWAPSGATVTANAATSPDGTNSADKLIPNTSTGRHYINQALTSQSAPWTLTVYAKAAGYDRLLLLANNTNWVGFNLTSGVVESTIGTGISSASIADAGNGWYRCRITSTSTATGIGAGLEVFNASYTDGNITPNWAGDGTSGVLLWGAQLEAGGFATSYIPTASAQVTRASDVAGMTGTNFSTWYNPAEGSLIVDFNIPVTNAGSSKVIVSISDNSTSFIQPYVNTSSISVTEVRDTGVTQANLNAGAITAGMSTKVAIGLRIDDFSAYRTGGTIATDASGTMPTAVNRLDVGRSSAQGGLYLNGYVRSISYFNRRLTNVQLLAA